MQKIALLYVRVSTGRQAAEGYSLESQHQVLKRHAENQGYTTQLVSETASGRISSRPALNRALKMLGRGEASALFALDIDRLARSTLHLLEIAKLAETQKWHLIITSANIDTSTPAGEMFFTLAAAFAQYESRMISQRVQRQHEARRERGAVWGLTEGPISPQPSEVLETIRTEREKGLTSAP
jgi:DNA invertase Pin-like site-specific DNA recombinase